MPIPTKEYVVYLQKCNVLKSYDSYTGKWSDVTHPGEFSGNHYQYVGDESEPICDWCAWMWGICNCQKCNS